MNVDHIVQQKLDCKVESLHIVTYGCRERMPSKHNAAPMIIEMLTDVILEEHDDFCRYHQQHVQSNNDTKGKCEDAGVVG